MARLESFFKTKEVSTGEKNIMSWKPGRFRGYIGIFNFEV